MVYDPKGHGRQLEGNVPQNPRLWEMLVVQAKQKYHPYPSLPASKWVHGEYVKRGGTFVTSKKKDARHDRRGRMTARGKKEEDDAKKTKD